MTVPSSAGEVVARAAVPLTGGTGDYDALLERAQGRRFVLLGEASHGSHEFYAERARITRLLIDELGFHAVAVEADWPDAHRVNCYVRGQGTDTGADAALRGFERFPAWMWRNRDVLEFVTWLRDRNRRAAPRGGREAGFYGLDLYSLDRSRRAVVDYLDRVDPAAADRARQRYACFDHVRDGAGGPAYGSDVFFGAARSCHDEVVAQLVDLCEQLAASGRGTGGVPGDDEFFAEQNARLVVDAEEYYRTMFTGRVSSWNVRDRHMADTLDAVADHVGRQVGEPGRVVVWAHNSHVGDARATELGESGELNVGQLARERHGRDALLVGFTTYDGSVTAADDWGGPGRRKHVRPALPGSYEELFHEVSPPNFLVLLDGEVRQHLRVPRLERAIGVIYRPRTERMSHYFQSRLAEQFDAVVHLDRTNAVEPLEPDAEWGGDEVPATFPVQV